MRSDFPYWNYTSLILPCKQYFPFILEHILEYCYSEAEMLQSKQNFRYRKPDIITFRLTGDEYDR